MTIDMSPEHERAKERVISFTNLGRVHKLIEERITNSPDGGVEINYVNDDDGGFRLARLDMAKDGLGYLILWDRGKARAAEYAGKIGPMPIGYPIYFTENDDLKDEWVVQLIHKIQHFLEHGSEK